MNNVPARLQVLIGNRSKAEFARQCGVPESSVRQWVDGTSLPSAEKLIAIANATGVSIDWLLLGKGQQKTIDRKQGSGESRVISIPRFVVVASAGSGALALGGDQIDGSVDFPAELISRLGLRPDTARVMNSAGTSMLPTIGDGDMMLVNISPGSVDPIVEGLIYVLSVGDAVFVKRLRRTRKGWVMSSDNRDVFPDEAIPENEAVSVHGRIVWAGRQFA